MSTRRNDALYGEKHPKAKLTDEQAREILKALMSATPPRQNVLARRYKVSAVTIGRIARGERYAHLRGAT